MATFNISNPPGNLGVGNFTGVINQGDSIAKSCRFSVRIFQPVGLVSVGGLPQNLTYLCEAAELPGRAFTNVDLRYYGPQQKLPINTMYEDINMTFICRSEMAEREFFDDWMELINPTTSYDFNYRNNYSTTIEIFQHAEYGGEDGQMDTTYQFTLFDAFPIFVNPQPVVWADDSIQRLVVTFTYSKWRRNNKDNEPPVRKFLDLKVDGPAAPAVITPGTTQLNPTNLNAQGLVAGSENIDVWNNGFNGQ